MSDEIFHEITFTRRYLPSLYLSIIIIQEIFANNYKFMSFKNLYVHKIINRNCLEIIPNNMNFETRLSLSK